MKEDEGKLETVSAEGSRRLSKAVMQVEYRSGDSHDAEIFPNIL